MENFALDRFPPHVLTNIFYFTSAKDLKNIMLVNSSCYEIVTSNSVLHKKFKLTLPENYDYDNTGLEAYKLQIQNSKIVFENISLIFSINVGALDIHTWFFEAYGKKIKMLELHEVNMQFYIVFL